MRNDKYDHLKIEKKWQKEWQKKQIYKTKDNPKKEKFYVLDMFPYPSGEGLHVGHPKGYIATDVVSRMKRMQGYNVLHPMGFDAFGLPAEQFAIKMKTNPAVAVKKNVERYKKQLEILGFDYDWSREINTTDPKYYKWTQWIFLKLFEKGLAYEAYQPINWCPVDKTGLANEDVEDGKCERCGAVVEKRMMKQWMLRITDYAERLLNDLDAVVSDIPLIERKSGDDKVRSNLPDVQRNAVVCILKHWKEDKYLCSRYKANDWKGFIVGGIEDQEDPLKAAEREIREESGYQNIKAVRIIGKVDSKFYHQVKNVNRFAHFTGVYAELTDDIRLEMTEEEKDLHDVLWLDRNEVRKFINRGDMKYIWDLFTGAKTQKGVTPMLDWPESIKESQRNWIGKSEGALIKFSIFNFQFSIEVFTTRPETIFGATYLVLAPEHQFIQKLISIIENKKEVEDYINKVKNKTEIDRTDTTKEKTGIELKGIKVTNPANQEKISIWVADYILPDYGTGAVMAVPAHDQRDENFSKKYGLKVTKVIDEETKLINSNQFNRLNSEEAKKRIVDFVGGRWVTKYKLRDWVFSRQRYWGEPIPVLHEEGVRPLNSKRGQTPLKVVPLSEKDLPLQLPKVKYYEPTGTGESPLANIKNWVEVKKGKKLYRRETNTMPQWAGSSWYYLRYMDPKNNKALVDKKKEKYWNEVDLYVGGAEHATRHLIYARFWHKFLYDIGVVSTIEPFRKLANQGLIIGEDGRKMSKRWGNVINPDDIVERFGADTLRVYEMFMGPFDQAIAWNTDSMIGARRFVERVWKIQEKVHPYLSSDKEGNKRGNDKILSLLHKTIKKVTDDISNLKFNTAISSLMILLNEFEKEKSLKKEDFSVFLKLLAPFAPHIVEEIWKSWNNKRSIHLESWPNYDTNLLKDDMMKIVVQVNGKVRATLETNEIEEEGIKKEALAMENIKKWVEGKLINKIIYIKGRVLNIVIDERTV
jgi:leucyl-tRNA synthetase